jgi:hypothetical protein
MIKHASEIAVVDFPQIALEDPSWRSKGIPGRGEWDDREFEGNIIDGLPQFGPNLIVFPTILAVILG